FVQSGRAQIRNVIIPAEIGTRIQPEFKPDRSEVLTINGRLTSITLIESAKGEQSHHIRKIMIDLSSAGSRACRAVIYPSGGDFYTLPVLFNRACGAVVQDPRVAAAF